jgi:hypothetical protein
MLRVAGIKSYAVFARNATSLSIGVQDAIRLIPTKNGGPRKGFVDIPERAVSLTLDATPEVIGNMVMLALAQSE